MATSQWSTQAVLLGFAEVRLPLRLLPPERQPIIANLAFKAITESAEVSKEEQDEINTAIGVIDAQYALQTIVLEINDQQCTLRRQEEILLCHQIRDVIYRGTIKESPGNIIYIARTQNFGRAAIILMTHGNNHQTEIFNNLSINNTTPKNKGSIPRRLSSFLKNAKGKPNLESSISLRSEGSFQQSDDSNSDDDNESVTSEYRKSNIIEPTDLVLSLPKSDSMTPLNAEIYFLIEQEKQYVAKLKYLENAHQMLSQSAPDDLQYSLPVIFFKITELLILHSKLILSLTECEMNVTSICKAFLTYKEEFQDYVPFIENIRKVESLLSTFSDYITPELPFVIEHIRAPRMRLNSYVLILDSLKKNSSEVDCIDDVISVFKRNLKMADKALLLNSVQGCPYPLKEKGDLIINSDLRVSKSRDLQRRIYHVILLEKDLVLTKGNRDSYQFITSFDTNELQYFDDIRGLYFTIYIGHRQNSKYTFKAKSIKLQEQWRKSLKNIIESNPGNPLPNSIESCFLNVTKIIPSFPTDNSTYENFHPTEPLQKNVDKTQKHAKPVDSIEFFPSRNNSTTINMLTIWSLFPKLKKSLTTDSTFSSNYNVDTLIDTEEQYAKSLLSLHYLDFEIIKICFPREIVTHFKCLYELHDKILFPEMKENPYSKNILARILIKYSDEFTDIYAKYLVDRVLLQNEISFDGLNFSYIDPASRLEYYMKVLESYNIQDHNTKLQALDIIYEIINKSNRTLFNLNVVADLPFHMDCDETIIQSDDIQLKDNKERYNQYHAVLTIKHIFLFTIKSSKYHFAKAISFEDCIELIPHNGKDCTFQISIKNAFSNVKTYNILIRSPNAKIRWISSILENLKR